MTELTCTACGGDGWLPSLPEGESDCPYCNGTGQTETTEGNDTTELKRRELEAARRRTQIRIDYLAAKGNPPRLDQGQQTTAAGDQQAFGEMTMQDHEIERTSDTIASLAAELALYRRYMKKALTQMDQSFDEVTNLAARQTRAGLHTELRHLETSHD